MSQHDESLEAEDYARAIALARDTDVDPDTARQVAARVRQRAAAMSRPPQRRAWSWTSFATGALVAAACVFVVVVGSRSAPEAPSPMPETRSGASELNALQIGSSVSLVHDSTTRYALEHVDEDKTQLRVLEGTVSVRLHHGENPHALEVRTGEVVVRARGTMFSVSQTGEGPAVYVAEGVVDVVGPDERIQLAGGERWPASASPRSPSIPQAFERLRGFELATLETALGDAGPVAEEPTTAPSQAAAPSPAIQWQRARLARNQGDFAHALHLLGDLATGHDPVWSPLALLEQARIHEATGAPKLVLEPCEAFLRRYATHRLAPEASRMLCKAQRQLNITKSAVCD